MHTHLSGDMGQHFVAIFEFNAEHGVRQWLDDRSFKNDRVFLGLRQGTNSCEMDQNALLRAAQRRDPGRGRTEDPIGRAR